MSIRQPRERERRVATCAYKTGFLRPRQESFILWYSNCGSKHESSALTEEYAMKELGGVGRRNRGGLHREPSQSCWEKKVREEVGDGGGYE